MSLIKVRVAQIIEGCPVKIDPTAFKFRKTPKLQIRPSLQIISIQVTAITKTCHYQIQEDQILATTVAVSK